MALRRPPTRIELKPDDIEEFEKVSAAKAGAAKKVYAKKPLSVLKRL